MGEKEFIRKCAHRRGNEWKSVIEEGFIKAI